MSQPKLSEFFQTRKRNADFQPSKRRKVIRTDDVTISTTVTPPVSSRTRRKAPAPVDVPEVSVSDKAVPKLAVVADSKLTTPSAPRSKASAGSKGGRTRSRRQKPKENSLQNIQEAFSKVSSAPEINDSPPCETYDVSTSASDDHGGSPISSQSRKLKRKAGGSETVVETRSNTESASGADAFLSSFHTPERDGGLTVEENTSARKVLFTKRKSLKSSPVFEFKGSKLDPKENSPKLLRKQEEETEVIESDPKPSLAKPLDVATSESKDTSQPSTDTLVPSETEDQHISEEKTGRQVELSSQGKVQKAIANPAEMRKKLAKCGKLSELKAKLSQFSEAKASFQKLQKDESKKEVSLSQDKDNESKKPAPAYQRFHSLASPLPPSLTLPFKYKVLFEVFQSTDTVVSMLHKRSEICTFSKLQSAVQQMRKKAFELLHLAQIKTVFPSAYIYRQEKGLPEFGKGHNNSYQLTVEANLDDLTEGGSHENTAACEAKKRNERVIFTPGLLLQRKNIFQHSLIDIVKQHHKEFLSKLPKPLSISSDKITRWHPKFPVDRVPDIPQADLPVAPDVKKFSSAKEVLEQVNMVSRFNPKIQDALKKVANQDKSNKAESKTGNTTQSMPNKASNVNTTVKGIPQSLLERIRAKEQEKMEETMMRSSKDEKRQAMLARLPNLIRILRAVFVTEKRPALLIEDVIQKMSDSYKTNLGSVEAEKQLKMIAELLPDWLTIVTVKKGRFLKLDKNKDMAVINERIDKLIKNG